MTPYSPKNRRISAGFTLIEVLIVVAIIGILVAVALPNYQLHVQRAKRANARAQLMAAGQYMQRFYAANDQYDNDRSGANPVWAVMPPVLLRAPADGIPIYEISVIGAAATRSQATPSTFTLFMRPLVPGDMATDRCGAFSLTQSGVKSVTLNPAAVPTAAQIAECWR